MWLTAMLGVVTAYRNKITQHDTKSSNSEIKTKHKFKKIISPLPLCLKYKSFIYITNKTL